MAKPTNYRGIHISVTYDMGYDYYEISQINKGKKWNEKTLFATLKEAKMYIDEHYDELIKNESKKFARKSLKESENFVNYIAIYKNGDYLGYVANEDWKLTQDISKAMYFEKENDAYKFISKAPKSFDDCDLQLEGTYLRESKKTVRKAMKEQFVGKGEGGYRKPDKTKFNSGICLDSNGVKHTVIFDTRVEDFIVWVDNDNYLMWYVSSPQSLLNNLAESDLDENLILDIVALWEKLPKKRIKN